MPAHDRNASRLDDREEVSPARAVATRVLAYCNMRTLYLRNVPDEVVERLERLAAHHATSVAAVAVRELADVSRRADHPELLGTLPDLAVAAQELVDDVTAARREP